MQKRDMQFMSDARIKDYDDVFFNNPLFYKKGKCLNLELKRNINFCDEKILNWLLTYYILRFRKTLVSEEQQINMDLLIKRINR